MVKILFGKAARRLIKVTFLSALVPYTLEQTVTFST